MRGLSTSSRRKDKAYYPLLTRHHEILHTGMHEQLRVVYNLTNADI